MKIVRRGGVLSCLLYGRWFHHTATMLYTSAPSIEYIEIRGYPTSTGLFCMPGTYFYTKNSTQKSKEGTELSAACRGSPPSTRGQRVDADFLISGGGGGEIPAGSCGCFRLFERGGYPSMYPSQPDTSVRDLNGPGLDHEVATNRGLVHVAQRVRVLQ